MYFKYKMSDHDMFSDVDDETKELQDVDGRFKSINRVIKSVGKTFEERNLGEDPDITLTMMSNVAGFKDMMGNILDEVMNSGKHITDEAGTHTMVYILTTYDTGKVHGAVYTMEKFLQLVTSYNMGLITLDYTELELRNVKPDVRDLTILPVEVYRSVESPMQLCDISNITIATVLYPGKGIVVEPSLLITSILVKLNEVFSRTRYNSNVAKQLMNQ